MVTNEAMGLGRRWLPAGGSDLAQVVLIGHAGQPGQEVAQVGERVLAVALAGDDQRVEDGGTLADVGMPDKQPVLLADAASFRRFENNRYRILFRCGKLDLRPAIP